MSHVPSDDGGLALACARGQHAVDSSDDDGAYDSLTAELLTVYDETGDGGSGEAVLQSSDSHLVALPVEVTVHVLKWLSAPDLASLAVTCRSMRTAAAEPSHWRRLCLSRWPNSDEHISVDGLNTFRGWKRMFFDKDSAECASVVGDTTESDDLLRAVFMQHILARRALPPSNAVVHADADLGAAGAAADVPGGADAARAVSAYRRASGREHDVCGVAHGCTFAWLGARGAGVAVCSASGKAHVCDDACSVEHPSDDGREVSTVCGITGRVRGHAFVSCAAADEDADEEGNVATAPDALAFLPGMWGRAYSAGYEANSERELHAALWGGSSGGQRPGKRRRASREVVETEQLPRGGSSSAQRHPRLVLLLQKQQQQQHRGK
jgi:F-box-like